MFTDVELLRHNMERNQTVSCFFEPVTEQEVRKLLANTPAKSCILTQSHLGFGNGSQKTSLQLSVTCVICTVCKPTFSREL